VQLAPRKLAGFKKSYTEVNKLEERRVLREAGGSRFSREGPNGFMIYDVLTLLCTYLVGVTTYSNDPTE